MLFTSLRYVWQAIWVCHEIEQNNKYSLIIILFLAQTFFFFFFSLTYFSRCFIEISTTHYGRKLISRSHSRLKLLIKLIIPNNDNINQKSAINLQMPQYSNALSLHCNRRLITKKKFSFVLILEQRREMREGRRTQTLYYICIHSRALTMYIQNEKIKQFFFSFREKKSLFSS